MARTLDDFRTHVAALISRPAWRPPAAVARAKTDFTSAALRTTKCLTCWSASASEPKVAAASNADATLTMMDARFIVDLLFQGFIGVDPVPQELGRRPAPGVHGETAASLTL